MITKKRRILLITRPDCGGAERMTLLYGKILERANYEIELLLLQIHKNSTNQLSAFIPSNWNVSVIVNRFRYLIFNIYRYLKRNKPDAVFCSTIGFSNLLLLLKFLHLYSGKIVVRDCNMPSKHTKQSIFFSRCFFRYADILIAQTDEMKSEMIELYHVKADKIKVIHNPIDKDLILKGVQEDVEILPNSTVFMACGRLQRQKDIITLIKAFQIVHNKVVNAVLYVIGREGDAGYMNEIHSAIRSCGVEERVFLVGFQENPYKYLKNADVFVLSSLYEGLPNVMLEAMYLGKPVAATQCIPYISQVVVDGKNGYTCPVQDEKALADCMLAAMNLKNLPVYHDINQSDESVMDVFHEVLNS